MSNDYIFSWAENAEGRMVMSMMYQEGLCVIAPVPTAMKS